MTPVSRITFLVLVIVLLGQFFNGDCVPLQSRLVSQRSLVPAYPSRKFCIPHSTFLDDCNWCKCNDQGNNFVCTTERCGNLRPRSKSYG
ncbi:hypothetical protein DMENIID0001_075530 [Sergentomyia squamirostris]